jgi:hypothetical protein
MQALRLERMTQMSDSNTATNNTDTKRPKSYLEQFSDLQNNMEQVFQVLLRQQQMIQMLEAQIANVDRFAAATGDMAEAVVSLLEKGEKVTKESVISAVSALEIQRLKLQVQKQVEEKKIVQVDQVTSGDNLVSVESDTEFGFIFNTASRLSEVLQEELVGKKAGDAVKSFKISAVYKVASPAQEAPEAASQDQASSTTQEG